MYSTLKVWPLKITRYIWTVTDQLFCNSDVTFPPLSSGSTGRACCHGDGAVPQSSKCTKIIPWSRLAGGNPVYAPDLFWRACTCMPSFSFCFFICKSAAFPHLHTSLLQCKKTPEGFRRRAWRLSCRVLAVALCVPCFGCSGRHWSLNVLCRETAGLRCSEGHVTVTNQTQGFCWVWYYCTWCASPWQIYLVVKSLTHNQVMYSTVQYSTVQINHQHHHIQWKTRLGHKKSLDI